MSKSPRILVDLSKIVHNFQQISKRCSKAGITLTGVVKGVAGDLRIIEALTEAGLTEVGDSRLENLKKINSNSRVRKMLLRIPTLSRVEETVEHCDISLNSEIATLEHLDNLSSKHQVFLMVDLGDLREGVMENDLWELGAYCRRLKKIEVIGLGTNFSCFAGAVPALNKLERLVVFGTFLQTELQLPIKFISGGNSSSLLSLYSGIIPAGINHLRIGEGILLGRETLNGSLLPDLYQDAFMVEAEIIQAQWKPSESDGEIGLDAFGRKPDLPFVQPGIRLLLNIGYQDTPLSGLTPLDHDLKILGGSSDYLVVAGEKKLKIGQIVQFIPNYWSLLGVMTSSYVEKIYIKS